MRATILLELLLSTAVTAAPSRPDDVLSATDEMSRGRSAGTTTSPAAVPWASRETGRGDGPGWPFGGGGDDDRADAGTAGGRSSRDDEERRTPTAAVARSRRRDDEPCDTVEGLWLSSGLETVFEVRATATAGRLRVRAVGTDWTGGAESLFGGPGPVTAFVSRPDGGDAATFVGHCRVSDRVDTITGIWVIASSDKNKLDHHLAVQPIPDTLHRLNVG